MRNLYHEIALILLLVTTFGLFSAALGQNVCRIPYTQPNKFLPLINSHVRGILYPVHNWSIVVQLEETIDIVCTGFNNYLVGTQLSYANVKCEPPGNLVPPPNFPFNCTKKMADIEHELGRRCGLGANSKIFQIGWSLPNHGFLSQVEVCFNVASLSAEYSKHTLVGSMFQTRKIGWSHRPDFRPAHPYNRAYEDQKGTVARLLRNSTLADAFIRGWGKESYLARGHLSPAGDFNFQSWKDATFHYINVVPQWQPLNNGNWRSLEDFIQKKASQGIPQNFTIYTGTQGVLQLPDTDNKSISIFLLNGTNQQQIPVPEHIWKIVYDEQRNEAVAFVLLNHPNNPQYPIQEPPPLCPDICDRITWDPWKNRNDKNKGKIYCCSVQSLSNKIPNLPIPPNVGLIFGLWEGFEDGYELIPQQPCS